MKKGWLVNRMDKRRIVFLIVFFCGSSLLSCHPFWPHLRNNPEGNMTRAFSLYSPAEKVASRWWQDFRNPELDNLITTALTGNLTLNRIGYRLKQARQAVAGQRSDFYPDLTGQAGVAHGRRQVDDGSSQTRDIFEEYTIGLTSSYELDLWGRVEAEGRALDLEIGATREDLASAIMSLTAEVADIWIRILSQRLQRELLQKQLENNQIVLDLIQYRLERGMVSILDYYQQEQVVERIKADIPLVDQTEQVLQHQLSLLLGRQPLNAPMIQQKAFPPFPEIPRLGLPADLLRMRPDIRAAGLRLQAADWQVAAARADRLPAIRLTGTAQYGGGEMNVLFDNWILRLGGNLIMPIFDAGRRKAEVERVRARASEYLAAYRETVLTAVREVEDALSREQTQKAHLEALAVVYATAQKAYRVAMERYRNGLTDYLPVLTQLLSMQDLERDLVRHRADLFKMRIGLYRALGGTWMTPDDLTGP